MIFKTVYQVGYNVTDNNISNTATVQNSIVEHKSSNKQQQTSI